MIFSDGSRRFAALPAIASWDDLRAHLAALPGARETSFLTDGVTEGWLDFTHGGHEFSVNDQFGEFWFFVRDSDAPAVLLREVAAHFERLLQPPER